jgi:uncharacterized protein YjbI with pentapeptide repeats
LGGLYYTARNLRLSRAGQLTDRFSKAIEQIGDSDINVRIGGLYALEKVARDSRSNMETVTEILVRFIQNRAGDQGSNYRRPKLAADIGVALKIVGRRPGANRESDRLDLSHLALDGADLTFAKLKEANLCYLKATASNFGKADLRGTLLLTARAERSFFTEADARECDFFNSDLRYSFFVNVNLERANFGSTDLRHVVFSNSKGKLSLRQANLTNARLDGTEFKGADLRATIGLTQEQINVASIDSNTKLPSGLHRQSSA